MFTVRRLDTQSYDRDRMRALLPESINEGCVILLRFWEITPGSSGNKRHAWETVCMVMTVQVLEDKDNLRGRVLISCVGRLPGYPADSIELTMHPTGGLSQIAMVAEGAIIARVSATLGYVLKMPAHEQHP